MAARRRAILIIRSMASWNPRDKQSEAMQRVGIAAVASVPQNARVCRGLCGDGDKAYQSRNAPGAVGMANGQCPCGSIGFEIDLPARWAWHNHSRDSRRALGAAYATVVESWRKRFRITSAGAQIARYEDKTAKATRSFCKRCGTPLMYERARSPPMVNISRALFSGRTGKQPFDHIGITGNRILPSRAAMIARPCVGPSSLIMMPPPATAGGRRRHEEPYHRALGVPRIAQG